MADRKNKEDRARAGGHDDDIMGIRHGGGRDQYGGSFNGGQSGGGAYANPHTGHGGGQGGNRVTGARGDAGHTGGQSNQGYYGSGQMGDRNFDAQDHNAASRASGPDAGDATYRDHPSQHGDQVDDARAQGSDAHQGFGREHQGQRAQGREHGGPPAGRSGAR
jgi:hypothetical protein